MTPLEQYPAARRAVYGFLWLAGLVLGTWEIVVWATDATQPSALTAGLAALPWVSSYVGYQGRANTPKGAPPVDPERLRAIPGTTVPGVPTVTLKVDGRQVSDALRRFKRQQGRDVE